MGGARWLAAIRLTQIGAVLDGGVDCPVYNRWKEITLIDGMCCSQCQALV